MASRGVRVVVAVWLSVLVALTAHRATLWTHERALWADAARLAPAKPRPWINLGNLARADGDDEAAERAYREAVRVAQGPGRGRDERQMGLSLGYANLGALYLQRGDVDRAGRCFLDATNTNPLNPELRDTLTWFATISPDLIASGLSTPASSPPLPCW